MTKLLGLDPGKATGFTYAYYSDTEPLTPIQNGVIEGGVYGFRDWFEPEPITIVSELYVPDGSVRGEDGTHSPRIEGLLIGLHRDTMVFQPRADKAALIGSVGNSAENERARNRWIDERWPGIFLAQHDRDAWVHLLVWAKRQKHLPTLRAYWGEK